MRFVPVQLFNRQNRFSTLVGLLFCVGTLLAIWTSNIWLPTIQRNILAGEGIQGNDAISYISFGMTMWAIGGMLGYAAFGFIADAIGRRPTILLYNLGTLLVGLYLYLGVTTFAPLSLHPVRVRVLRVRRLLGPCGVPARAVPDPCARDRRVVLQRHRAHHHQLRPAVRRAAGRRHQLAATRPAVMTCFALLSILAMALGRETRYDELPR